MLRRSEYAFSDDFQVTEAVKRDFDENGFILLKGVLDKDELSKIEHALTGSDAFKKHIYVDTVEGSRQTAKIMWSYPGNDITGMLARSEKVAGVMEMLLGGEVYHYHTKLMMKNGNTGVRSVWHQDYGYWYLYGNLFPDMGTVFIALDQCTRENSCLQVLRGSHKCGRLDHHRVIGQMGCDEERMSQIKERCPMEYIEMDAGDALYFHCNLIHSSSDNTSDRRRWAFLTAYNRASNNPTMDRPHPRYTPLHKVPNSAIKSCTNYTDVEGKHFMSPEYKTVLPSS